MAESVRVEIGFSGGATTAASLDEKQLKRLRTAIDDAEVGTVELESESGSLLVRTEHVAFVRVHARESRVGF
jgi:hypothetical protein